MHIKRNQGSNTLVYILKYSAIPVNLGHVVREKDPFGKQLVRIGDVGPKTCYIPFGPSSYFIYEEVKEPLNVLTIRCSLHFKFLL